MGGRSRPISARPSQGRARGRRRRGQSFAEYAILCGLLLAGLAGMVETLRTFVVTFWEIFSQVLALPLA